MSFNGSEYFTVAQELVGLETTAASQTAKCRSAISRAYYAAFVQARNHLRDREGHSIPTTGAAHQYVWQQFKSSSRIERRALAEKLKRLKNYRNQADYADTFPGLSGITSIALSLAEEILDELPEI